MNLPDDNSNLVYSTAHGAMCPGCAKPVAQCICRELKRSRVPQADGVVRVRYDTKGRKGKGMTLIAGVPLCDNDLDALARKLKQRFGTGGSVKERIIELQGDQRAQAAEELQKLGYKVKQG